MRETVTVRELARVLHESCPGSVPGLAGVGARALCRDLVETLSIESNGGMWLKDGSRRRSPGWDVPAPGPGAGHTEERRGIFGDVLPRLLLPPCLPLQRLFLCRAHCRNDQAVDPWIDGAILVNGSQPSGRRRADVRA